MFSSSKGLNSACPSMSEPVRACPSMSEPGSGISQVKIGSGISQVKIGNVGKFVYTQKTVNHAEVNGKRRGHFGKSENWRNLISLPLCPALSTKLLMPHHDWIFLYICIVDIYPTYSAVLPNIGRNYVCAWGWCACVCVFVCYIWIPQSPTP